MIFIKKFQIRKQESEKEQEKINEKKEILRKLEEEEIRKATVLADEFLKRDIR